MKNGKATIAPVPRRTTAGTGMYGGRMAPPLVHDVLRSSGRPLDRATRTMMERRFGRDLSGVRVHADASAAASARAVGALAYTVGRDVVFGAGRYAPHAAAGRHLLAHELAHVVQQGARAHHGDLRIGNAHDGREHEANGLAAAVLRDRGTAPPPRFGPVGPLLQRQTDPDAHEDSEDEAEQTGAEQDGAKTPVGDEPGESSKKPKSGTARRKRRIRVGNFVGSLLHRALGLTQPKYFHRSSAQKKPQQQYIWTTEKAGTKTVTVVRTDTSEPDGFRKDTADIWAHGNRFFQKGDVKGPRKFYDPDQRGLFADPGPAAIPKGGRLVSETTTSTVTGTLKFSFGDVSDTPGVGGLGRIVVTAVDATGATTIVYPGVWMSTQGKVRTVVLKDLPPNAGYSVTIGVDTWWAGRTEHMYDLALKQVTTTTTTYQVDVMKRKKVPKPKPK